MIVQPSRAVALLSGVLLSVLILPGCATVYNPATGKQETLLAVSSDQQEQRMGHFHYAFKLNTLGRRNVYQSPRVNRVGNRLLKIADRRNYPYYFIVVNDGVINAGTVGGYVFINHDFAKMLTDDELAGVLAHELAHNACYHMAKKQQWTFTYDLVDEFVLKKQTKAKERVIANYVANLIFNGYSQHMEIQADRLAVRYLDKAGYELDALVNAMLKMETVKPSANLPFFDTHPPTSQRLAAMQQEITVLAKTHQDRPVWAGLSQRLAGIREWWMGTKPDVPAVCLNCGKRLNTAQVQQARRITCPYCQQEMQRAQAEAAFQAQQSVASD